MVQSINFSIVPSLSEKIFSEINKNRKNRILNKKKKIKKIQECILVTSRAGALFNRAGRTGFSSTGEFICRPVLATPTWSLFKVALQQDSRRRHAGEPNSGSKCAPFGENSPKVGVNFWQTCSGIAATVASPSCLAGSNRRKCDHHTHHPQRSTHSKPNA
jgi:hypothetical protein